MKLAFLASESPISQAALADMTARYDNHSIEMADVVVALGGDGFMLEVLHREDCRDKPVFGLNRGTVGFLMNNFEGDDLLQRISKSRAQSIRPLRVIAKNKSGKIFEASAINDVSMLRQGPQAANLRILVDDRERIDNLMCDGVVLSTPAGSTAYNFSANGPILPIGANVLALTPLAAFRPRRWRGAVLPDGALVTIEVLDSSKRPVMVSADSQGFSDVVSVEIALETRFSHKLLFDPNHSLEDRILNEQFC